MSKKFNCTLMLSVTAPKIKPALLAFYVSFFCSITGFAQDKIIGKWLTSDKSAHIQIFKQGSAYFGKIVWLKEPINPRTKQPWIDNKNPDKHLQTRPVMGLVMVANFSYNSNENLYFGGTVYDCRKGETYKGKIWLSDDNTLKMRGYVFVFYRTETWTRINE